MKDLFSNLKVLILDSSKRMSASLRRQELESPEDQRSYSERFNEGLSSKELVKNTILESENGTYLELDMSELLQLKSPKIDPIKHILYKNGFKKVGVLQCDPYGKNAIIIFASEEMPVWAKVVVYDYRKPLVDFYTDFEEGFSMTSTMDEFAVADPSKGINVCIFKPKQGLDKMYEQHCIAVNKKIAVDHQAVPASNDLKAYAEALDKFISRRKASPV